ncbi:hypothetical protein D3C78_1694840 [compost metagenome]
MVIGKQTFAESLLPIAVSILALTLLASLARRQLQRAAFIVLELRDCSGNHQHGLMLSIAIHR